MKKVFGVVLMHASVILSWGGAIHMVDETNRNYKKLRDMSIKLVKDKPSSGDWLLPESEWKKLEILVNYREQVKAAGIPGLTLGANDSVLVDGLPVYGELANILAACIAGQRSDASKFVAFTRSLKDASESAKKNLFNFIDRQGIAINDRGNVLALKIVSDKFLDLYTGKLDNSPGRTVKMARSKVVEDVNVECAAGLHACTPSYLSHYGSSTNPTMLVEIEPRHFVSVPENYHFHKARVEQYLVLQNLGTRAEVEKMGNTMEEILKKVDQSKNAVPLAELSVEGEPTAISKVTKPVAKPAVAAEKVPNKTTQAAMKEARTLAKKEDAGPMATFDELLAAPLTVAQRTTVLKHKKFISDMDDTKAGLFLRTMKALMAGDSYAKITKDLGVSRSTAQGWNARIKEFDAVVKAVNAPNVKAPMKTPAKAVKGPVKAVKGPVKSVGAGKTATGAKVVKAAIKVAPGTAGRVAIYAEWSDFWNKLDAPRRKSLQEAIKLYNKGVTFTEVAKRVGISRSTIQGWQARYAKAAKALTDAEIFAKPVKAAVPVKGPVKKRR